MSRAQQALDEAFQAHQNGDRQRARAGYQKIVAEFPAFANAWHLLGMLAFEDRDFAQALDCVQRSVTLDDQNPFFFHNLGLVLRGLQRHAEAEIALRRSLELQPNNAETLGNLGLVLVEMQRMPEAKEILLQATTLNDRDNIRFNTLGIAHEHLGEFDAAERCYRRALAIAPNDANATANLAVLLTKSARLDEAITFHKRAVELKVDSFKIWTNLGQALSAAGKLDEAVACHRRALQLSPTTAKVWNNLGSSLKDLGRLAEAQEAYRRGMEIDPDAATHSNLLLCMIYDENVSPLEIAAEHRHWGDLYGVPKAAIAPHDNAPDPDRRLNVGYVSADFRTHAVARFVEPILANHDPQHFNVFCYSHVPVPDAITERLRGYVPNWIPIQTLNDDELEARIRRDRIDILVDLSGHTAQNRLLVFARKPAPIQITCIGYPVTTGLTTMDYRLTDEILNPEGEATWDTEQLLRLPVGSACFVPDQGAPDVGPLPALKNGFITFGSPHNRAKLNNGVFGTWAKIMQAVPNSKLIFFRGGLVGEAADSIRAGMTKFGIDESRLDIRDVSCGSHGYAGYMQVYNEIDICLDTFPGNAGTTACESLWMGVPLVALYGDRFFGRQTSYMLNRVGLQNWFTKSLEDYVDIAVRATNNLPELAALRQSIRTRFRQSPIGDPVQYTRGLEHGYRVMWQHWVAENRLKN